MWSLEKLPKFNAVGVSKNSKKKVGKFDDEGNLLKTYDSGRQTCREEGNGVQNVLSGKYPKHKGFVYKYI